jgi:hypothetical protein
VTCEGDRLYRIRASRIRKLPIPVDNKLLIQRRFQLSGLLNLDNSIIARLLIRLVKLSNEQLEEGLIWEAFLHLEVKVLNCFVKLNVFGWWWLQGSIPSD